MSKMIDKPIRHGRIQGVAHLLILLTITMITSLFLVLPAQATVYVSDHFDSQSDWDGCTKPPSPWSNYTYNSGYCGQVGISGASGDAHSSSGKSVKISWPNGIMERGMETWNYGGKSEVWMGFWWRHDAGYTMGSDNQDKWIYFPQVSGNRTMLAHVNNSLCYFTGTSYNLCANTGANPYPNTSSSAWYNDTSWHSFVIYISPASKDLRVWRDGTELTWNGDNLNIGGMSASTFDSDWASFGYQSRSGWSNNVSYFDDIIVASTQAEVLDFLGTGGAPTAQPSPTPTNVPPTANAGSDQTLTDTDNSGLEQVQLNGSASSDPDGSIASYAWKEGSVILSTSPIASVNLAVGTHTIDLTVTDDKGAQGTDSTTITVAAGTTSGGTTTGGTTGEVLLQEAFDDTSTSTRGWYDAGAAAPAIASDPQRGKVLEYAYTSGASTPTTGALRHLFPESDEVTLTYNIKYQAGWQWVAGDSGPHELYLMTNLDDAWKGPAQSHGTTYIEMHQGIQRLGFQDALNIDQTQIGVNLAGVSENRGVFGCNGTSDKYPDGICWGSSGSMINGKLWDVPMTPIQNDRWYQVKVHFKMNSIVNGVGVADGVMEYWLDGQLLLSLHDVMIRTGANPNLKWNQIMIAPYFHNGTSQPQKFWIDDLSINSTSATAPSAPTGLRIL